VDSWNRMRCEKRLLASNPLNGTPYTVVGIVPASFFFMGSNFRLGDAYIPIGQWTDPTFLDRRIGMGMDAVARLKPGATLAQARSDMLPKPSRKRIRRRTKTAELHLFRSNRTWLATSRPCFMFCSAPSPWSWLISFSIAYPAEMMKAGPDVLRNRSLQLDAALEAIPGVESVSAMRGSLPMQGDSEIPFWLEGQPAPTSDSEMNWALFYLVEPGYLNAMQTPLQRGRFLNAQDTIHSPPVIVIDENFARKFFPARTLSGSE
jgi:MacB-like protein